MVQLHPVRVRTWDPEKIGKWLNQPIINHPETKIEEETITYPQLLGQFVGMPLDADDYFASIHELLEESEGRLIRLSDKLNKQITPERLRALQDLFEMNNKERGLSPNRIVAFLDGKGLLPRLQDPGLNRRLRLTLIDILKAFKEQSAGSTTHSSFRRIVTDLVKWTFNHIEPELEKLTLEKGLPGFLWYGSVTESQKWFLKFSGMFGFHVIVFDPAREQWFAETMDLSDALTYNFQISADFVPPFPEEKPQRVGTVAYRATQEVDRLLHHDDSGLYKPFQFKSYLTRSIRLKTTLDEAFMLAKERAMVRPSFAVEGGSVIIPVVFAKVMGIEKDRKRFWDNIHNLTEREDTKLVRSFPFIEERRGNQQFHYRAALGKDGRLDPEKMKTAHWWKYSKLPNGLQTAIGEAIARHVEKPLLLPQQGESFEELQLYAFSQSMSLPDSVVQLIQLFDYPQFVPTMLFYNEEKDRELGRADANAIALIHTFGLDVIIVNPQGHQDIERWIDPEAIDTHWLDERSFNEPYREPSVVKKLFRKWL
ncbi:YceG family protein [Planomicrobium sp. CPCC 101110]|uniref:YceG family protein n=1 Tax=Planomicrobium sp. CPCC 101110 TaxID=2599619 RepID=UPI0011B5D714|nr:YceG family protein [Planomicrobium sp. CPCC 101110]TWT27456.1 tellurium resistance protein [Planomicrobium sp. CPCC 101110]